MSCTGTAPTDPGNGETGTKVDSVPGYSGPAMKVRVEGDELLVTVEASTGGYSFVLVETAQQGDHTLVKMRLTGPARDEVVTQAIEQKEVSVPLAPSATGALHVSLQQKRKGEEYTVEPPFQLAKIAHR